MTEVDAAPYILHLHRSIHRLELVVIDPWPPPAERENAGGCCLPQLHACSSAPAAPQLKVARTFGFQVDFGIESWKKTFLCAVAILGGYGN